MKRLVILALLLAGLLTFGCVMGQAYSTPASNASTPATCVANNYTTSNGSVITLWSGNCPGVPTVQVGAANLSTINNSVAVNSSPNATANNTNSS